MRGRRRVAKEKNYRLLLESAVRLRSSVGLSWRLTFSPSNSFYLRGWLSGKSKRELPLMCVRASYHAASEGEYKRKGGLFCDVHIDWKLERKLKGVEKDIGNFMRARSRRWR